MDNIIETHILMRAPKSHNLISDNKDKSVLYNFNSKIVYTCQSYVKKTGGGGGFI